MNLTKSQLQQLLGSIGLAGVQVVDTDEESDFELDTALRSVDDERGKIIRPLVRAEMEGEVASSVAGRIGGTLERVLVRELNVDAKVFTKDMKDPEKIQVALAAYKSRLTDEQKTAQQQIDEIITEHNKQLESLKTDYEGKLSTANEKYTGSKINDYLQGKLKEAPLPKDADRTVLSADFKQYLANKYHLSYDEVSNALGFYQKDNKEMPALNSNKTAQIDVMEEAKSFFEPRGLWAKDMRGVNPAAQLPPATANYKPATGTPQNGLERLQQGLSEKLKTATGQPQ